MTERKYVDFAPHLLWQCTQCGSVVADMGQHEMWHDYPGDWNHVSGEAGAEE